MSHSLFGQLVGNFKVTDFLGAGAMGAVYLGEHTVLGHKVAIKVMLSELRNSQVADQAITRFISEAKALTQVKDLSHIIRLHDFGKLESGEYYYVMEYHEGRNLESLLLEKGPIKPNEALPYIEQICAGLQAAHDCQIIHRDLKPANILLVEEDPVHLKLLDFGLAKRIGTANNITVGGMGSPLYTAPEQIQAERGMIQPQTDIYSLGVISYEMLSGRMPYNAPAGISPLGLFMLPAVEPHVPLRQRAPELSPVVTRLIDQCLEKDPQRRPESASKFFRSFKQAVEKETSIHEIAFLSTLTGSEEATASLNNDALSPGPARVLPPREALSIGRPLSRIWWKWAAVFTSVLLGGGIGYGYSLLPDSTKPHETIAAAAQPEKRAIPAAREIYATPAARASATAEAPAVAFEPLLENRSVPLFPPASVFDHQVEPNAEPDRRINSKKKRGQRNRARSAVKSSIRILQLEFRLNAIEDRRKKLGLHLQDLPSYDAVLARARQALSSANVDRAANALDQMAGVLDRTRVNGAFITRKLRRMTQFKGSKQLSPDIAMKVQRAFSEVHSRYFAGEFQAANDQLNRIWHILQQK